MASHLVRELLRAVCEDQIELLEVLDGGAPVDGRDELGMTALGLAVWRGKLDAARLLLERGADVSAGVIPPIAMACVGDREPLRALLLEHGAALPPMEPFAVPQPVAGQPKRTWTAESIGDAGLWHARVYEGRVLVGCAGGQISGDPDETLSAWAVACRSRPAFQAFVYNAFLLSRPIAAEELAALAPPVSARLAAVPVLSAALSARDHAQIHAQLDVLEAAWEPHISQRRARRAWCPLCRHVPQRFAFSVDREGTSPLPLACQTLIDGAAPFGGDGGETCSPFRCWLCHTHYYHQHEYEYDPGGSWDDHYYVRLDLGEALARVRQDGTAAKRHHHASAHAYLRLFVYAALLLAPGA